jgi:hypothetical protein
MPEVAAVMTATFPLSLPMLKLLEGGGFWRARDEQRRSAFWSIG